MLQEEWEIAIAEIVDRHQRALYALKTVNKDVPLCGRLHTARVDYFKFRLDAVE